VYAHSPGQEKEINKKKNPAATIFLLIEWAQNLKRIDQRLRNLLLGPFNKKYSGRIAAVLFCLFFFFFSLASSYLPNLQIAGQ
jgi:hypothetical protein